MENNAQRTGISILVVEDSPTQAEQLRYMLDKHGFQVTVAYDGTAALASIAAAPPSMVISDIVMPEMNGYQLCASIRANPATAAIPVVLLTYLSSPGDILLALESGADNFITKPYKEENLIPRVFAILDMMRRRTPGDCDSIDYQGRHFRIHADRRRILELLISTYESAVNKNRELQEAQNELRKMNFRLEMAVDEATEAKQRAEASVEELYRKDTVLQQWNSELKLVHEIGAGINQTGTIEEMFALVCDRLSSTTLFGSAGRAWICSLDESRLSCCLDTGHADGAARCAERREDSPCGIRFPSGTLQPFVIRGEEESCRSFAEPRERIVIPLMAKDTLVGILSIEVTRGHVLDQHQIEVLGPLGHQIGIVAENLRLYEETRSLSLHDPLTGLANRRMLAIRSQDCLARSRRFGTTFCIIILDIDHFKKYNDTYGHDAGDRILERTAAVLRENTRSTDLAARYGGEEFVLLLNDSTLEGAMIFAERIREGVEREVGVTISAGVATSQEGASVEAIIKSADEALYAAKRNGRNRVEASTAEEGELSLAVVG